MICIMKLWCNNFNFFVDIAFKTVTSAIYPLFCGLLRVKTVKIFIHSFPTRQSNTTKFYKSVSWFCRNFPSNDTNQYLEPRCLLEHEETKNERKKQTKRETKFASVEGKPLSIYAANVRTAAVGIQDLGIPAQPDKPTTLGQRRDHFSNNTLRQYLIK